MRKVLVSAKAVLCLIAMASCLLLLNVSVVLAQSGNAQLGGLIEDPSKALIPGVTVTATNVDTNVTQTTLSNDSGTYNFPVLPPGKYQSFRGSDGLQESC